MNRILSGRTSEVTVKYLDCGDFTMRFAKCIVGNGYQLGSTEGEKVSRIIELDWRIKTLRAEWVAVRDSGSEKADILMADIEKKARMAVERQDLLRKSFMIDLEAWANGSSSTGIMIQVWSGHTKLGLLNTEYKTLELDTGNVVYCQFGEFNGKIMEGCKLVERGNVRHNVELG